MVKIEAVIQPLKLEEVRAALETLEIREITISQVMQNGDASAPYFYRGAEYRNAAARVKLEVLVSPDRVDEVISAVMRASDTSESGEPGGKILTCQVANASRIHSGVHVLGIPADSLPAHT
jgi:nitrogen regulatory protein P-II 1